jgi:sucrose phosphorylase
MVTPLLVRVVEQMHEQPSGSRSAPQLIAYADRLGGSIQGLCEVLRGPLAGAFGGVHVLPFYLPFDGADAGFDPEDHATVDPRLGTWENIRGLARTHTVVADLIVNHVSARSAQFRDVVAFGDKSPWSGMFLTLAGVFPGGAREAELAAIYRPRPGLPFTAMTLGERRRLVWTTFTADQVDLDVSHPRTWAYLTDIVDKLTAAGVTILRLDALGYVGKRAGTNCFLTDDAIAFTQRLRAYAHERGAQVLVEVHGHHRQQIEIAALVDRVYDFALPPLVLHAILAADADPLSRWLAVRPTNAVTVLDTHDGIGIVDVGVSSLRPGAPGLLTDTQIDNLVEAIHTNGHGSSRLATGAAASNLDLYQVNCTFYEALACDDLRYLIARLIQLFVPGVPQIYYVGLLAGRNDVALLERTGVGRDINRSYYSPAQLEEALERPVVQTQLAAIRFRAHHPAFGGAFSYREEGSNLELGWSNGDNSAVLRIDFADLSHELRSTVAGETLALRDLTALTSDGDLMRHAIDGP